MRVIICPDAAALSRQAAALVAAAVTANPRTVLGLAAGATPIGLYRELGRHHGDGLDFSAVTAFGLDEYYGLPAGHPASFRAEIERQVLSRVALPPARLHWPEAPPGSHVAAACAGYERAIAEAGGIDLQILGIGANGHIGFNEPGSSLAGRTRLVRLSDTTRRANAKAFASPQDMPEAAVTQGIGTILAARRILLLASGEHKAAAVAAALEGPLTAMLPASALQLHPEAVVFLDAAAAAGLQRRAEYQAQEDLLRRLGWPS